ncbi:putative Mg(2+) transport ATPase [Symmachiella dynata]|nr:putative Mg(2+) transport ATPase [Symmachiella dynata]
MCNPASRREADQWWKEHSPQQTIIMFEFIDSIPDIILRPLMAVLCAAVLGFERETQGKAAGLRTQMMVGLGTAIFTMAAWNLQERLADTEGATRVDPTRVIAGIVGGLGFLGAGSIIQAGKSIRGLTTAATVWVVGAVGIACGLGDYLLALVATGFATIILVGVGYLEHRTDITGSTKSGPPKDS